jgi:hypothetical protein
MGNSTLNWDRGICKGWILQKLFANSALERTTIKTKGVSDENKKICGFGSGYGSADVNGG